MNLVRYTLISTYWFNWKWNEFHSLERRTYSNVDFDGVGMSKVFHDGRPHVAFQMNASMYQVSNPC